MNFQKAGLLQLLIFLFAIPVVAQKTDDEDIANGLSEMREKALNAELDDNLDQEVKKMKAQQLFEDGVRLFRENRLADAGRHFKEAYNMLPSWKLLYNIGQCEAGVKNWGAAIESFEKYLLLGGDEISLVRQDEVLAELDRLKQMVGKVSIEGAEGYKVYVDGEFVGISPIVSGVMISIGMQHTVIVADATTDETVKSFDVSVSGGEHLRLTFRPDHETNQETSAGAHTDSDDKAAGPVPAADSEARLADSNRVKTDSVPQDRSRKKISPALFVVSLSTTVAAAGATLGLVLTIQSKWESAESDYNRDPWSYDTDRDTAIRRLQIVSYVTGGLAVAALAGTLISIPFTDWKRSGNKRSGRMHMQPYGSMSSAGLILTRSF